MKEEKLKDNEKAKKAEKKEKTFPRRKRWPATIILLAPFMLIAAPLYKAVRKYVDWAAALAMVITFELIMFLAEYFAVSREHWIWNPDRVAGPMIFGKIPIEEPLLYYWFPPLFVVVLMHVLENRIRERR